jgi:hypothetical protein
MERESDGASDRTTLLVTIDQAAKTVMVGSWGTAPIFRQDDETLIFMVPGASAGVSSGSINNYTGAASIHIITVTDGVYVFNGKCSPATRIF